MSVHIHILQILLNILFMTLLLSISFFYFTSKYEQNHIQTTIEETLETKGAILFDSLPPDQIDVILNALKSTTFKKSETNENLFNGVVNIIVIIVACIVALLAYLIALSYKIDMGSLIFQNIIVIAAVIFIEYKKNLVIKPNYKTFKSKDIIESIITHIQNTANQTYLHGPG